MARNRKARASEHSILPAVGVPLPPGTLTVGGDPIAPDWAIDSGSYEQIMLRNRLAAEEAAFRKGVAEEEAIRKNTMHSLLNSDERTPRSRSITSQVAHFCSRLSRRQEVVLVLAGLVAIAAFAFPVKRRVIWVQPIEEWVAVDRWQAMRSEDGPVRPRQWGVLKKPASGYWYWVEKPEPKETQPRSLFFDDGQHTEWGVDFDQHTVRRDYKDSPHLARMATDLSLIAAIALGLTWLLRPPADPS